MGNKDQRQRRKRASLRLGERESGSLSLNRFDTLSFASGIYPHPFLPSSPANARRGLEGGLAHCHGVRLRRFAASRSPPLPRTISLPCSKEAFHYACCSCLLSTAKRREGGEGCREYCGLTYFQGRPEIWTLLCGHATQPAATKHKRKPRAAT